MKNKPTRAFILAAGKGTRLRPYTDTMPKPMVDIAGTSIIRRAIAKLVQAGVTDIVVNLHHLGDVLEEHLKETAGANIIFSHEDELLETGGGIKKALHYFEDEAFYIINGDALWDEGEIPALEKLAQVWSDDMDILLLLQPTRRMELTGAVGDYRLKDGKATREKDKSGDHMFAGVRIAHPRIFKESPEGAFSFLSLMDRAEEQGRLYGLVHSGHWYHISTPEDLQSVNEAFRKRG
ncbi:MAG TPA: nucleotidyltransferase family protein [Micavibrio sp.]|nr:nucleotidyltransferase family protein [Micavibrio sp.]